MGCTATTGIIVYWKPDQPFVIHRYHHIWFEEYNSRLFIEYNHTPDYLLYREYPERLIHNSELLNFNPCEVDITSTPL